MATLTPEQKKLLEQGQALTTAPQDNVYFKRADESIEQYNTRIASFRGETITEDLLNPVTTIPFVAPTNVPTSPITIPPPPAPLGTEQTKESDLSKQIQRLQEEIGGVGELVGKEELEIQKRGQFGVEAKIATQQSIFNQLQNLKAQTENIPEQVAGAAAGRLIVPEIQGRQQRELLRQAGIQSNILNAQFNAATGDLATAERRVKQAVQDAFGTKEAELNALEKNLASIRNSSEYRGEVKARTDAADTKRKAEEAKVAAAKSIYEDILKLTTTVTGSAVQDGQNNLIANQITDLVNTENERLAVTPDILAKAQALAQRYLVKQPTGTGDINEFKQFFPNVDLTTSAGQQQYLDWKAQVGAAGRKGEIEGGKIFTETTMTPELRSDIIDTLSDREGIKKLGKLPDINDLVKLFPNVEVATLQSLMDKFQPQDVEFEGETQTKKWYQFWK
mgnify:CR=1 FL=1